MQYFLATFTPFVSGATVQYNGSYLYHCIIDHTENKGGADVRGTRGAGGGSGAAKAREGTVIGAKEVV